MIASLSRILTIGRNTLTEAVRQKVLNVLLIFSIVLVGSSVSASQLATPGLDTAGIFDAQIKFVKDFGCGSIGLFGFLIALLSTAQLIPQELHNRTIYTILAKPVRRAEFLLGKFLGVVLLLVLCVALMSLAFAATLYYQELRGFSVAHDAYAQDPAWRDNPVLVSAYNHDVQLIRQQVQDPQLIGAVLLIFMKLLLTIGIALFVSTFATSSIFTIVMTFLIYLIGHMEGAAREVWLAQGNPVDLAKRAGRVHRDAHPRHEFLHHRRRDPGRQQDTLEPYSEPGGLRRCLSHRRAGARRGHLRLPGNLMNPKPDAVETTSTCLPLSWRLRRALSIALLLGLWAPFKIAWEQNIAQEQDFLRYRGATMTRQFARRARAGPDHRRAKRHAQRGADFVWLNVTTAWMNQDWWRMGSLINLTTALQPRAPIFWDMGGWHLAYNASIAAANDVHEPNAMRRLKASRFWAERGLDIYKRGLENNPTYWRLWSDTAQLYNDRFKDYPTAAAYYQKASEQPGAMTYLERFPPHVRPPARKRSREGICRVEEALVPADARAEEGKAAHRAGD